VGRIEVRVWDVAEGKELQRLPLKSPPEPASATVGLAFALDGRTLLTCLAGERVTRRWDALTASSWASRRGWAKRRSKRRSRRHWGNMPSAEAKQRLEQVLGKLNGKLGPNIEAVRAVRGVVVLERIGTPDAQKVLEEFARAGQSRLSAEARTAAE